MRSATKNQHNNFKAEVGPQGAELQKHGSDNTWPLVFSYTEILERRLVNNREYDISGALTEAFRFAASLVACRWV